MDVKFELLGTADVGERVYATPAFADDKIYVRSLPIYSVFAVRRSECSSVVAVQTKN